MLSTSTGRPVDPDVSTCTACHRDAPQGAWFCPACGAALPAPDPSVIEGRYRLEEELGRGSMGLVFAAHDLQLDRRVAVKIITPTLTRSSAVVAQLRAEARALATVRSEHVVRVHSFGTHGGRAYFAMELVEGSSLARVIEGQRARGRAVPISRSLTLLEQIARGLDAVHAAGLVHRDVKPGNVMVEQGTDRPVLVDFGLALSALSKSGEILPAGTPAYMAPEQIAGARVGPTTDVYAFACSAFELLTGVVPFPGTDVDEVFRCHLLEEAPPPSRLRAELAPLDEVFASALAKEPHQRQSTCTRLVAELLGALGTRLRVVSPTDGTAPPPAPRGPLIVVVEPDATFARACARAAGLILFGTSPTIVVAPTAEDARRRLGSDVPDLVLIDGNLGTVGGEALLAHLRSLPGGDAVSFVAVHGADTTASGLRLGLTTPTVRRDLAFPELLGELHAAIEASGLRTGSAPARARHEEMAPSSRRRPTG